MVRGGAVILPPPRYFDRELETSRAPEIRALQDRLVAETMQSLHANEFFSSLYRRAGVKLERIRTVADLQELPIIRKADIVADAAARPPFGSRLGVAPEQVVNIVETSGTSASGKEVQALSAPDLQRLLDAEQVGFIWGGACHGSVVAVHLPVSMTAAGYWWNLALFQLGCNTLRLGGLSTEARLAYLATYRAEQMIIDGHYLNRMTHFARESGYRPGDRVESMATILIGGGGWSDENAERWADEWGAVLHEQYGSSQRCIAWSCERGILDRGSRGLVHTLPHQYLVEVLDPDTGMHVEDGEVGEIVLTLFGYQASPLVRYGTRDRGRFLPASACPCGRPFDGIEAGSVGRLDDMLRVRGLNLFPDQVDRVVFATAGIVDYQGEAWADRGGSERLSLLVSLVADAAGGDGPERVEGICLGLAERLRAATGLRFEVGARTLSSREIEETARPDVKPRRWSDRRDALCSGPRWTETP
jgi:phenylacetate-CoA ligase